MDVTKKYGFTLTEEVFLSEVDGNVKLYKHDKTGAELLSISNKDINKSFAVSFRTPPKDSTGVAHILEHSVLCGSKNYPVKEPFVELLKTSLQTFLNAMTFPDKTCYPVASTNLKDFYNLVDVYMDAVFYPLACMENGKDILDQEGWYIDTSSGKWEFKGVVFNEMKGVYSSPDSILSYESQQLLFPDSPYQHSSGGDPKNIPDLTYEDFKAFHANYYHPSNARFFFWGDDNEDMRLEKVDSVIQNFEKIDVEISSIPLQKSFTSPKSFEIPYEVSDIKKANGHSAVSWLLCESSDVEKNILFSILAHILTKLPGSPLRKALIDSGLGQDYSGGLSNQLIQSYFSVGLRAIKLGEEKKMENLILETLKDLVKNKIPQKAIDAALNSIEFSLRDPGMGHFSPGLAQMTRSLTLWLYDKNPLSILAWEKPLADIKARLANKEAIFENLIQEYLLDNSHRILVTLVPDETLTKKKKQEEENRIKSLFTSMNEEEKAFIESESKRILAVQNKENSPEALATIPVLSINDVEKTGITYQIELKKTAFPLYCHDINTIGVLYSRLIFSLDSVPFESLSLLPIYARALTELGTKNYTVTDLGLEIECSTNGLQFNSNFRATERSEKFLKSFVINSKITKENIPRFLAILDEIIFSFSFDNKERFIQMVREEKTRLERRNISGGQGHVFSRLDAKSNPMGLLNEHCSGITYFEYIKELDSTIETKWEEVKAQLEYIHASIFKKDNGLLDLTADTKLLQYAEQSFKPLLDKMQTIENNTSIQKYNYELQSGNEAFVTLSKVNYVGMGINLYKQGYNFHGSGLVVSRVLRMVHLWDKIRIQGGAYGCAARFSRLTGDLNIVSYRDPQVEKSYDAYKQAPEFLRSLKLSEKELSTLIVGTIGDIDKYMLPAMQGITALWQELSGETAQLRQKIREEVFSTKIDDFYNYAHYLEKGINNANYALVGGEKVGEYAKTQSWNIQNLM